MADKASNDDLKKKVSDLEKKLSRLEEEYSILTMSNARFEALSYAAFEAIFLSKKGICLDQNLAAAQMFGYTREEAKGKSGIEWIVPEDRDLVMKNMLSGYESPYTVSALRKDGTSFPAEIQGRSIESMGEKIRVTALRDISKREEAEQLARVVFEQFQSVMDALEVIIYVSDMETYEILFMNQHGKEIFGDVVGKTCWMVLQKDMDGPCDSCTNSKLVDNDGRPLGSHHRQSRNTRRNTWFKVIDKAIYWIDNRVVRLEIAADITEMKNVEDEKQRLIEDLEKSLSEVKLLKGIIPICSFCHNIRNDKGYWDRVESYLAKHSDAEFTHGICPECLEKHYPEFSPEDE